MPRIGTHQGDVSDSPRLYPGLSSRPQFGCYPFGERKNRADGCDGVPLQGTVPPNTNVCTVEEIYMFLLGRNMFCYEIHKGGSLDSSDTRFA